MRSIKICLFTTAMMLFLTGCVGTVQDAKTKLNEILSTPAITLSFEGIVSASAISHNKIEIEFFPQTGSSADIRYLLYINGSVSPIELNPEALDDATGGKKRYLIRNLNIASTYKLKLKAKNIKTQGLSTNEKEVIVKTFDNRTAEFLGVNALSKVVGDSARSIKVEWVPALMQGLFVSTAYDPVYYELTYISTGGPQNLNNKDYAGLDRKTVRIPPAPSLVSPSSNPNFTIIDNLTPETTYYVQVRSVNKLYHDFASNINVQTIPVDKETNNRYLRIKTDSASNFFDFARESLVLQNAPGVDAYNKVNLFWSSGSGTFASYRIYWKLYAGDPNQVHADDEMTNAFLVASNDYVTVGADATSAQIPSLTAYKWYQFKVVLCKTVACPMDENNTDFGIPSSFRAIRTEAVLAPFSGITFLQHPKDSATLTRITAQFDPPSLTVGFADAMELYCLDPNNHNSKVLMSTVPTAASGVGNCDGLALDSMIGLNDNQVFIDGVNNTSSHPLNQATYCFAMTPAIRLRAEQKPLPVTISDMVVRCISPEIKVPTITEFPGLNGGCSINQNDATVNWTPPSAGIYSNYRVFIKEVAGADTFKFSDAVATDTNYVLGDGTITGYESILLPKATLNYTFTNLRPGRKYKVGVLTIAVNGASELNSEFNVNIKECNVPMPTATFEEWTRIFAVGPKIDGRFPKEQVYKHRTTAHMWEALNTDGIPYEVKMSGTTLDDTGYAMPPGFYSAVPNSFGTIVDATFAKNGAVDVTASRDGIISLAWKDVNISFLDSEFETSQNLGARATRTYGYKVFRSDDNRISWIDLTTDSKLIHARPYKYRVRSNQPEVTERMAFFTDYSVKYSTTTTEVERARTYWYKVVPYFEGKALSYTDASLTPPNIIKVNLPPPNMALIHRMMANRQGCLEIDNPIDKTPGGHYRCDYDGLGARPKGFPWSVGETALDQGGDLLVDRYEVGCNYTRGELIDDPTASNSFFVKGLKPGATTGLYDFKGSPTDTGFNDLSGFAFKGCVNGQGKIDSVSNMPVNYSATYKKVIWGDCLASVASMAMPTGNCALLTYADVASYGFPGAVPPGSPYDCTSNVDPDNPQTSYSPPGFNALGEDFRRNLVTQSEYAAVMYVADTAATSEGLVNYGPNGGINNEAAAYNSSMKRNCFINLAAIGADDKWRARWFEVNELYDINFHGTATSVYDKTISQVIGNTASPANTFYNNTTYKAPSGAFRTSDRYDDNTRLARIATSNSAKLPPITGIRAEDAESICNTYQVQLGIGDDTTSAFIPTTFPVGKELLNKTHITTAAAWPDAGDNNAQDLNYTNTMITNLEAGAVADSCIDAGRTNGAGIGWGPVPSDLYTNSVLSNGLVGSYVFSGSSVHDTGPSSDKCISRYGIQDIVGNLWEMTNTAFNCDYTKDTIYFGQYGGGFPVTGTGVGVKTQSVPYSPPNVTYIWKDAPIEIPASATTLTNNYGWVDVDPTSGYCSIVDQDPLRVNATSNVREISGIFLNVFLPDGNPNVAVVPLAQPVNQDGVNYLRNGDAFFFNMGQNNLAPQFGTGDGIALNDNGFVPNSKMAMGPYFNPLTGLPLSCGLSSCDPMSDNRKVTTTYYQTRWSPADTVIQDFPTGNSQIRNTGISDYYFSNAGDNFGIYTYTFGPGSAFSSLQVVRKFTVNSTMNDYTTTTTTISALYNNPYTDGQTIQLVRPDFYIPRNSYLGMYTGGGIDTSYSGRYSMTTQTLGITNQRNYVNTGFRCSVLVNTDD